MSDLTARYETCNTKLAYNYLFTPCQKRGIVIEKIRSNGTSQHNMTGGSFGKGLRASMVGILN